MDLAQSYSKVVQFKENLALKVFWYHKKGPDFEKWKNEIALYEFKSKTVSSLIESAILAPIYQFATMLAICYQIK